MAEPITRKAKNTKTGQEVLLYQHPDGSWKRNPPPRTAAPAEPAKRFDQQPTGAMGAMGQDALNAAHAFTRMDLLDKVFAAPGAALASLTHDLPADQPGSVVHNPAVDARASLANPLRMPQGGATDNIVQDMNAREAETPVGTTLADIGQGVTLSAGLPSMSTPASLPGRMAMGALEGAPLGAAAAVGDAPPGQETPGDMAEGAGLGGMMGAAIPGILALGRALGGSALNNIRTSGPDAADMDKALAAGVKPSFTGTAGLKLPGRMEADAAAARAIKPGAQAADKAYDDLTNLVAQRAQQNVASTLQAARTVQEMAIQKYPGMRISTEPLRQHVNQILVRNVADVTPQASARAATKASRIEGVEPDTDLASLSSESDLPLGSAESLRRFAEQLTRRLPPEPGVKYGKAIKGSPAERKAAGLDDLTSDLIEEGQGPTKRLAEFTVSELVELRRNLDEHAKHAQKLGQDDLVRSWGQLSNAVRGMLADAAPDVGKAADEAHKAMSASEKRLAQLGLPEGTKEIDAAYGSPQWQQIRSRLIQDPTFLRQALASLGPDVVPEANYASGTIAAEKLMGGRGPEQLIEAARNASFTNQQAGALGILRGMRPVRRAAAMTDLPKDSSMLRRGAIAGMVPVLEEPEL